MASRVVRSFFLSLLVVSLGAPVARAAKSEGSSTAHDQAASDAGIDPAVAERHGSHHAWAPIAGYNPTYKVFLGGAYFYEVGNSLSLASFGIVTFESVFQIAIRMRHRLSDHFEYSINPEYSQGYEPYYGEGGNTPNTVMKIFGAKGLFTPTITYRLDSHFAFGFYGDYRMRREFPNRGGVVGRVFPNEDTIGIGAFTQLDYRDDETNPTEGYLFRADYRYVPAGWTTVEGARGFSQTEGGITLYRELLPKTEIVAAMGLRGGITFGDPTYAFRYRLGGSTSLRGYLDNRFRGKKFYLQQNELRFPIWKMFNGAFFVSFGDTTDSDFTAPKVSYGVGIRLGLPPDWVTKARIDIGWGKDQSGVFVDFGYPF